MPVRYKLAVLFSLLLTLSSLGAVRDVDPFGEEVSATSAIMVDMATGRVLYAKDAHKMIHPASTMKMATALFCYKILKNRLDEKVTMTREMVGAVSPEKKRASNYTTPAHWIETASSHMGLKLGEEMSLRDLFKGCLIVSANDASNALALSACGSYSAFTDRINRFVKELGCSQTIYRNPHGLFHPEQVSTVYDLSLIARALMQEPFLREVVAQGAFQRPKTNKQEPAVMHNGNRLIRPGKYFCKWACGLKTGYTTESGGTLVSCAKNADRSIVLVVSGEPNLSHAFSDSLKLIRAAMNESKNEKCLFRSGSKLSYTHPIAGAREPVEALVKSDVVLSLYPSEALSYKGVVHWQELVPPIRRGQFVGKLEVSTPEGQLLASSQLLATQDIDPTLLFRLRHWVSLNPMKSAGVGLAMACGLSLTLLRRRLHR